MYSLFEIGDLCYVFTIIKLQRECTALIKLIWLKLVFRFVSLYLLLHCDLLCS